MNSILNFKFFFFALLAGSTWNVAAQTDHVIDEVAWVVGDDAIFRSDIEEFIMAKRMNGEAIPENAYCKFAEELALRQLFLHQAELDSIPVSEEMLILRVNSTIEEYLQEHGKERFEELSGKTVSQYREYLRQGLKEQALIEGVTSNIRDKINVTPSEVRNYIKEVPEDSIPFVPTQVEVELLVREPVIPLVEIDRVKDELRDYTERVNNGMSFSSLAILYSEDAGTARYGGEVGLSSKSLLDQAFAAVAFNLQDPAKVSRIVQSEYGYHIMQLIERRGDRVNVRHILRRPRVSDDELNSTLVRMDSIADDIRAGKFTFEAAVALLSEDKDTYRSNGLMQNPNTLTSRFEMEELPQEIAKTVDKMNVNEVSKPFLMRNRNGKEVCAIVKLKTRISTHRASVAEDFVMLQNIVIAKKSAEAVQKWIREKQKKTFVRVNENWRNCEFKYPDWKL